MAYGKDVVNSMRGKDYSAAISDGVIKGLVKAAIKIEEQAVELAPVQTGRLRGSITWAIKNDSDYPRAPAMGRDAVNRPIEKHVAYVGTNVEYAAHMEFGTVRSPSGRPFLRPAVDSVRHDREIKDTVKKAMKFEQRNMRHNIG